MGLYARACSTSILIVLLYLATTHASQFQQQAVLEAPLAPKNAGVGYQETSASSARQLLRYGGRRVGTGFAAFGDSYSAGIGTGVEGEENDCRQGLHAYPQLVASDHEPTAFQFLSCTGATTDNVMVGGDGSQIDLYNTSLPADFAFLSIGGNDLGFFEVINACVFRFYNFYSGTCESALAHSAALLDGDDFETRLRITIMEILDKARWEKKPWFSITMTGYARFFNEVTDGCDDMSFGVWWDGPRLTKKLRLDMNALVLTVNAKLRKTIAAINADFTKEKVIFVDYDDAFEGHRFCEPNVTEPDYERADTWFFLVGGPDNARNGTQPRRLHDTKTLSPTSPLADPSSCLGPARRSGDWGLLALCYMAIAKHRDPTLRPARGDVLALSSMWYVPTYYGKTFHPRSLGHEIIRNKIYETWCTLGA
ncbi:SGNH hydrolase [Xylaria palmicola]|nr:SGNH hydrolase [Xylaria palmicola]